MQKDCGLDIKRFRVMDGYRLHSVASLLNNFHHGGAWCVVIVEEDKDDPSPDRLMEVHHLPFEHHRPPMSKREPLHFASLEKANLYAGLRAAGKDADVAKVLTTELCKS